MPATERKPEQEREGTEIERKSQIPDEMMERISKEGLVQYIDGNRLSVKPVFGDDGKTVKEYEIQTKKGTQLFRVSPDDMMLAAFRDTLLQTNADEAEITGSYELIEAAQRSLRRLGIPEDQIPKDSHLIAQDIKTLAQDIQEIQQIRTGIETQNTLQGLMRKAQKVFEGGKKEWEALDPYTKRMLILLTDPLAMLALQRLGVDHDTVQTAESVKKIALELTDMRREAAWYSGLGKALKDAGVGAVELIVGKEKGILPGAARAIAETAESQSEINERIRKQRLEEKDKAERLRLERQQTERMNKIAAKDEEEKLKKERKQK
jgi:hypothetical protein